MQLRRLTLCAVYVACCVGDSDDGRARADTLRTNTFYSFYTLLQDEIGHMVRLGCTPKIGGLFLMFVYSNWFLGYQFGVYNAGMHNVSLEHHI